MNKAKGYIQISEIVLKEYKTLKDFLYQITSIEGGFKNLNSDDVKIYEISNINGFSGYNYWIDEHLVGQIHLASLKNGKYVIYQKLFFEDELSEVYSFYDEAGNFLNVSEVFNDFYEAYESIQMDPTSPLINHLYNILLHSYELTANGLGDTKRIALLEDILNSLFKSKNLKISANTYTKDTAYSNINSQMIYLENDKILKWTERQKIFDKLLEKKSKIIKTKKRVHEFSWLTYSLPFLFSNFILKLTLIRKRPVNNLRGIFYKYTIGKILWFLKTVKENLGYSIALAIYGPFTYYFITQPMNPHAMWVVGEVREAYIGTTDRINKIFNNSKDDVIHMKQDAVSTQLAGNMKDEWQKRISQFKAMNIDYESNLIYAERIGRLEQIETQLNIPLAMENAWNEIVRYQRAIKGTLSYIKNLDQNYKNFLNRELIRSQDAQVYIWEKMSQLMIDYPYILVDQEMEQSQKNAYTGRAFVFMQRMNNVFKSNKNIKVQTMNGFMNKLANHYKKTKIKASSTLESLRKNSKLFASNNIFDTQSFRSYMKRHWEILLLQQNKKQEASSLGMQAYYASVKNSVYTIQSLYSTKRDDHLVFSYKFNKDNQNTENTTTYLENNEMIEELLHFIVFDYVSIKREIMINLPDDKEIQLKEKLINNIKSYVVERDSLLKQNNKSFSKTVTERSL